jgi:hypothetical protein
MEFRSKPYLAQIHKVQIVRDQVLNKDLLETLQLNP